MHIRKKLISLLLPDMLLESVQITFETFVWLSLFICSNFCKVKINLFQHSKIDNQYEIYAMFIDYNDHKLARGCKNSFYEFFDVKHMKTGKYMLIETENNSRLFETILIHLTGWFSFVY